MPYKVFLYPQTLFYPIRVLKADSLIESYYLLNLLETQTRIKTLFSDKISKIHFLSLKSNLNYSQLSQILSEIKNLGLFLRTPESLKIYKLHQDLFEETYPLFRKINPLLSPIERSFILLSLAEDIDFTLLEVSLSLEKFSKTWEKIFEEKILFKDPYFFEEAFDLSFPEEIEKEKLWELKKRMNCLKVLLPEVNFSHDKPDTLFN